MPSHARRHGIALVEHALLLAMIPVLTFPRGWLPALALLIPAVWIADRRRWHTFREIPWFGPILLLAAAAALSTWFAPVPSAAVPKLLALLLGIAAVITIARTGALGVSLAGAITLFLLAGVALAAALLIGTNWMEKWPAAAGLAERLPRLIRGLPGAEDGFHPNAGAGALLLFFPSALQAAISREWPSRLRTVAGIAAVMIGFVLILTQSRGAIAGLALGTALTGALIAPGKARRRLQLATAGGAAVLVIALALLFTAPARLERIAGPNLLQGLSSRIELWDRTASIIWDYRWSGLGFNGFRNQIQAEQPLFLVELYERPPHAHNTFLQTAADLGLAGLAIYATLLVMVTADLSQTARTGASPATRAAAAALLAGWLAHLSFGLTDAIPLGTKVGFVFWLTVGLAGVILRSDREQP